MLTTTATVAAVAATITSTKRYFNSETNSVNLVPGWASS